MVNDLKSHLLGCKVIKSKYWEDTIDDESEIIMFVKDNQVKYAIGDLEDYDLSVSIDIELYDSIRVKYRVDSTWRDEIDLLVKKILEPEIDQLGYNQFSVISADMDWYQKFYIDNYLK